MDLPSAKQIITIRRVLVLVVSGALLAGLGTACTDRDRSGRPAVSIARSAQSRVQIEAEAFRLVNDYRRSRGLPELVRERRMDGLAQAHAERMAKRGKLDHHGSRRRFRQLQREPTALISFAENVAYNLGHARPGEVAVQGWLASPGHHRNILRPNDRLTGVGAAMARDGSWYLTQLHGRRE